MADLAALLSPGLAPPARGGPGQLWRFAAMSRYPGNASQGALSDARTRKLDFKLLGAGQATIAISGRSPQVNWIEELRSDLVAYRWSSLTGAFVPMFRGCITQSQDQISPTVHTVTFTATDYRGMLGRRFLRQQLNFAATDQGTIAAQLAAWGNVPQGYTGAPLGLTTAIVNPDGSPLAATGVVRDRTYYPAQIIEDAIDNLSTVIGGFDWSVEPSISTAGVATFWYPRRGVNRSTWVAEYGSTVDNVDRVNATSTFGNFWMALGEQQTDGSTLFAEAMGPAFSDPIDYPEGLFMATSSQGDVSVLATLQQTAQGNLAIYGDLEPSYTLRLVPGRWDPSDCWLGDSIAVRVRSGRLAVDTVQRITEIQIDVGDDGSEVVTLTTGIAPATVSALLAGIDRRLDTIERR